VTDPIDLASKLAGFSEHFSPRTVATAARRRQA